MRLTVRRVLLVLADNPSWDELQADYPDLEPEDVKQVLAYAAARADDQEVDLLSA